jgi:hypothetical protein
VGEEAKVVSREENSSMKAETELDGGWYMIRRLQDEDAAVNLKQAYSKDA